MSRTREANAAYMREYRARKRAHRLDVIDHVMFTTAAQRVTAAARIAALEAEVRHLKAELAKRPSLPATERFNTRPFTPVPKHR